jgi:hypothetical protein
MSKHAVKQDNLCGVRTGPEVQLASCSVDRRRLFTGLRRPDMLCTKRLQIEPNLKISGSVLPVPTRLQKVRCNKFILFSLHLPFVTSMDFRQDPFARKFVKY